jgi:hypothetical protein
LSAVVAIKRHMSGPELDESLKLLLAMADAFATRDEGGRREPLYAIRDHPGHEIQHPAFDTDAWRHVDEEMIDRLADRNLIRVDYTSDHVQKIYVSEDGERLAAEIRRLLEGDDDDEAAPVDLSWEGAGRPTLEAAYKLWVARGAPRDGVLTTKVIDAIGEEHEERSVRIVALLLQDDYVAAVSELGTQYGPTAITVTARGLQVVAGWPATTAEAAAGSLLAALEQAIKETDEPERRSKLERLRDVAVDVGQGTLSEVLKHVITGGL